jgi:hypothetical protein
LLIFSFKQEIKINSITNEFVQIFVLSINTKKNLNLQKRNKSLPI